MNTSKKCLLPDVRGFGEKMGFECFMNSSLFLRLFLFLFTNTFRYPNNSTVDQTSNISAIAESSLKSYSRPAIIGRVASGGLGHNFKELKLSLKAKGYPIRSTRKLVTAFLKKNEDLFKNVVSKDCFIIPVPSGSGKNMVTELFANELQKMTGCSRSTPGNVWKTHFIEAKHNLSLEKRLKDPINYDMDVAALKKEIGNKQVIILDDVIGSGESCIKLKKQLNAHGIQVTGFVNLVTIDKSYPTTKDITRLVSKIGDYLGKSMDPSLLNFTKDCCTVFGEYTRQKMNRVERVLRNATTAKKAFDLITLGATIEESLIGHREIVSQFIKPQYAAHQLL